MAYTNLFKPGKIGNLRLKNRVVMTAMGCGLAEENGIANEDIIRYYEERAKGGVGLIITEVTRVEEKYGTAIPNQLAVSEMYHIGHLEKLVKRIHKYGTKIFLQLHHPGRENKSAIIGGRQIVAPSPIPCQIVNEMPRELTTEECEALVKDFIKGAIFAQSAGFDGVELHGAHGYLINQFLSPISNQRTDKYGGSKENRFRFVQEIIQGIRKVCGRNFVISVRLSADEFFEGGLTIEDSVEIAKNLEKESVDVINVSSGIYESGYTIIEPNTYKQCWKKHLAKTIKENISIPVIAVNNIKEPSVAESLLEENVCDYIGLARPLLADPFWAKKAYDGKDEDINPCIGCLYCILSVEMGERIKCAVNAKCGREKEFDSIEKVEEEKTVVVIGGGPAGMSAAIELNDRGYKVVLIEKNDKLSGQLVEATAPVLKDYLDLWTKRLVRQVENRDIEVKLNTNADIDEIKKLNPYAVFVATGGSPIVPNLEGIDKDNVITAKDYLLKEKDLQEGKKVLVVGGGITGMETAETIAEKNNKEVTLIEMMPAIGKGIYKSATLDFYSRFKKLGVNVKTNAKLEKIDDEGAHILNMQTNEEELIEADTIVLALGVKPDQKFTDQIVEAFDNVRIIGDAQRPGRIAEAVENGFSQASAL